MLQLKPPDYNTATTRLQFVMSETFCKPKPTTVTLSLQAHMTACWYLIYQPTATTSTTASQTHRSVLLHKQHTMHRLQLHHHLVRNLATERPLDIWHTVQAISTFPYSDWTPCACTAVWLPVPVLLHHCCEWHQDLPPHRAAGLLR